MSKKMIQVGVCIDPREHDRCSECNHMLRRHEFFMEETDGWNMGETVYTKCNCKNCKCDGPLSLN